MFRHIFVGKAIAEHFGEEKARLMGQELFLTTPESSEEAKRLKSDTSRSEDFKVRPIPEEYLARMREHVRKNGKLPDGPTYKAWED